MFVSFRRKDPKCSEVEIELEVEMELELDMALGLEMKMQLQMELELEMEMQLGTELENNFRLLYKSIFQRISHFYGQRGGRVS